MSNLNAVVEVATREEMDAKDKARMQPRTRKGFPLSGAKAVDSIAADVQLKERVKDLPIAAGKYVRLVLHQGAYAGKPVVLGMQGNGAVIIEHGDSAMLPERDGNALYFTVGPKRVYLSPDGVKVGRAWAQARKQLGLTTPAQDDAVVSVWTTEQGTYLGTGSKDVMRLLTDKDRRSVKLGAHPSQAPAQKRAQRAERDWAWYAGERLCRALCAN